MRRRLFEVLTCLSLCGMLLAQVETSTSIRGLVTDASGAAVPDATVIIRNTATNESRTIITNDSGFYAFPSIIPGTYDVTITHAGFKKAEVTGRVAQVSESAQVDVTLEVGQTSDSVTVSAAGAELLSTSNAEIGGVLQSRLVNDIPLNGRNFFDLAVMLPHVSLAKQRKSALVRRLRFERSSRKQYFQPVVPAYRYLLRRQSRFGDECVH